MKINKYFLGAFLVLTAFSFYSFVLADNDKNMGRGNEMRNEHAIEAGKNGTTLEVHLYNNGKVLVRGAKVTSVSGNTVNAYTSWNSVNINWSVNLASANSTVVRRFGGNGTISDISIGDIISFQGDLLTTTAAPFTVNATVLKDWSIQKNVTVKTTIDGTVKTINGATSPTTLVITSANKDYTVNVASDTSILSSSWAKASLSSFKIGDRVRAYGSMTDVIMNATVIRDVSLR